MGMKYGICLVCNKEYYGQGKYCCSIECRNKYRTGKKIIISNKERKNRSERGRLKKGIKLTDEHRNKIGNALKERWKNNDYREKVINSRRGHIVSQETRNKISKSQKGRKCPWVSDYNKNRIPPTGWHHSDESKRKISEKVSGSNNGRYGKTPKNIKPIEFIDIRGRKFLLRSNWEVIFAKYLDLCNIEWEYEKITYELNNGNTYTPDFFTENCIFEVKGLKYKKSMEKFYLFKKHYPNINIVLVDRNYLVNELKLKL